MQSPSHRNQHRRVPSPHRVHGRSGISLVEVMVALLIMSVGVFILSSTVTTALAHAKANHERTLAVEATSNVIEELHSVPFSELLALYNGVTYDDPAGAGSAPGRFFDIDGLDAIRGEGGAPLPVGRVILPTTTGVLREDVDDAELGMPRDLDGDLIIDSVDHSRDYLVMPIIVRVRWQSSTGPRSFQMQTMLAELGKL